MVRVKICGLTCVEEAVACAELGAEWIGLNFHRPSPRYVSADKAAAIVAALPPSASAAGVFVDRPPAEVAKAATGAGIGIIQLHGQEPEEDLVALRVVPDHSSFPAGSGGRLEPCDRLRCPVWCSGAFAGRGLD